MSHLLLETLASLFVVEENLGTVPITLNVKGVLVTGEIISKKEYFDAPQNASINSVRLNMIRVAEENGLLKENEDDLAETHIYLKNASYISGSQHIPNNGIYIAVAVNSIDSFSMGVISGVQVKSS